MEGIKVTICLAGIIFLMEVIVWILKAAIDSDLCSRCADVIFSEPVDVSKPTCFAESALYQR